MVNCKILTWSTAQTEPVMMDRAEPGESDDFTADVWKRIDCERSGVVISGLNVDIRPEDDDGLLTIGSPTYTGTVYRIPFTTDPDLSSRVYAMRILVSTSDGRSVAFWHTLPVVPTTPLHA